MLFVRWVATAIALPRPTRVPQPPRPTCPVARHSEYSKEVAPWLTAAPEEGVPQQPRRVDVQHAARGGDQHEVEHVGSRPEHRACNASACEGNGRGCHSGLLRARTPSLRTAHGARTRGNGEVPSAHVASACWRPARTPRRDWYAPGVSGGRHRWEGTVFGNGCWYLTGRKAEPGLEVIRSCGGRSVRRCAREW